MDPCDDLASVRERTAEELRRRGNDPTITVDDVARLADEIRGACVPEQRRGLREWMDRIQEQARSLV